jgi:hypothetical protein
MKCFAVVFAVLLIFIVILSPLSFAGTFENWQASPWVTKEPYMEKIINKLGFGLTNGLTGWTALLFEPCRSNNFFTGLVKGSWRTITNTVGGALHIVTFPIPIDIPLPDGGVHFD